MENYKPNSYKSRENQTSEKRNTQKVVKGPVKVKKKSEVRKFADVFISEDVANVKKYVFMDVLIPALKKTIYDTVTNSLDMILYGESGKSKRSATSASKVSYRSFYDKPVSREHNIINRSTYSYDDVILDTRGEAEAVLMQLDEIMTTYDNVKVADLYDVVGITGSYTDNNYGWTDIRSAQVIRVRDGYMIKLPRAKPLD